ncbi:hypothetical protein MMC06_002632 [Schaereria dolodes]|nr:hypothetical protein [Schaereria dolodes]
MPAQRPCALFEPIPPDLDLAALVEQTPNFEYVVRIPCETIDQQGQEAFEKLVLLHVIIGGKPLVIEGFHQRLDQWTFTSQWLRDNVGTKCILGSFKTHCDVTLMVLLVEQARNLTKRENMPLSIGHYLKNMAVLTNQWNSYTYKEPGRQRIYLKDIDCPQVWHDKLKEHIPASVFYLNESTGDIGGPGSINEASIYGPGTKKGKGVARAGDLMSCLPPSMRAENMMCYIGHEGTYTPAHREMCASLGQNIMVEASGVVDEDGKPSKPGSSIWFMTETKDRHLVSEYWLSTLGHDIEVETHYAQINAWKAAPFTTYIVDQKVGDFILIPPLAPHQVWNRGTRTMKAAWNRTTVETLEMALNEALPRARMVCRDEQYKNKAIVLFTLQRYSGQLKQVELQKEIVTDQQMQLDLTYSPRVRQLQKDFKRLFALYTRILLSEMLSPVSLTERRGQYLPYDSNVTCSYCRCNIFNRFLTCTSCITPLENGDENTYDICMECYAMGRSCQCLSKFKWVEQFPWRDLVDKHELWRHQIIGFEGGLAEDSPQPLNIERKKMKKKTLGQVCQEQLKARPWQDPQKAISQEPEKGEVDDDQVDGNGTPRKRRKIRRSDKWHQENQSCHICRKKEALWKLASCDCGTAYCYGSLWRGYDIMPLAVMENPDWKCPRCRKICTCTTCRKDPESKPFEPNGTILGHDTKKIADPRSVESLVDFSHSNISWIKKAGDDHPLETRRLQRRRDEASIAKSRDPALDHNYVEEDSTTIINPHHQPENSPMEMQEMPIDPQLSASYAKSSHCLEPLQDQADSDYANNFTDATADRLSGCIRGPLPPVATLLDEKEPRERFRENTDPRRAAAQALQAMKDMSRLEQDPEDFAVKAGLRNHGTTSHLTPQFLAPEALMLSSGQNNDISSKTGPNGISYEYPDPTSPISNPAPCVAHRQDNLTPQNNDKVQIIRKLNPSSRRLVQSDILTSSKDPNQQFQQAQVQRKLAEARRNNRYISAEAALFGKSLCLKIPFDKLKLAELNERDKEQRHLKSPAIQGEDVGTNSTVLLQSDLPKILDAETIVTTPTDLPKKRMIRVEPDDDFATRKPRNGQVSVTRAEQKRKSNANYIQVSDESEADSNVYATPQPSKPKESPKGRRLPSYLARRNIIETNGLQNDGLHGGTALKPRPPYSKQKKSPDKILLSNSTSDLSVAEEVKEAGKPPDGNRSVEEVIDAFAADPMPDPVPTVHLSTLGPGRTKAPDHDITSTNQANMSAKTKAVRWAVGSTNNYESESDSGSSDIELATPKPQTFEDEIESQHDSSSNITSNTVAATGKSFKSPLTARKSIFAKAGMAGKKIKITAVRPTVGKDEICKTSKIIVRI